MRKLQCPECGSVDIHYCPMVEEYWTIEEVHEDGALDLKDLVDQ